MSFKHWYLWVRSLPWSFKWFVILVLLRPFIDQYYELKRVSPLLSPLYWAGILTILPSFMVIVRFKTDKASTRPYKVFILWAFLYILALVLNFTLKNIWSVGIIAIFMKYITLIPLFLFLTRFVHSDYDIVGIMTTFFYSCLIIIILIIISGNFMIKGLYDTVQNIAFYISLGYIVNTYLYMKRSSRRQKDLWKYFAGLTLALASFITLQHIATMAVILVITLIFLYYSRKISFIVMISSTVFILIFWNLFGNQVTEEYVEPQLSTEIKALKGEKESARMFHGRMSRWEVFIPMFFKLSPMAVGLGSGYEFNSDYDLLLESNIHNDYFRILLASGIIGLLTYLYFLYSIFKRIKYFRLAEKFLLTSSLAVLLLYSVTAYPTIYPNVMYVVLSIFAFALRPIYTTQGDG